MVKFIKLFLHLSFTILLIITIPTDHRWWVLVAYYGFTFLEIISFGIHLTRSFKDKRK